MVSMKGDTIDESAYMLDWAGARLIFADSLLQTDSLVNVTYRVFPILLTRRYRNTSLVKVEEDLLRNRPSYLYS